MLASPLHSGTEWGLPELSEHSLLSGHRRRRTRRDGQRCEQVDHVGRDTADAALRAEALWPEDKRRRTEAAIVGRALAAAESAVTSRRNDWPSVVGREDDQRGAEHASGTERTSSSTKRVVHRSHHRSVSSHSRVEIGALSLDPFIGRLEGYVVH